MVKILVELERALIQERTQAGRAAVVAHARTLIGQEEPHDSLNQRLAADAVPGVAGTA